MSISSQFKKIVHEFLPSYSYRIKDKGHNTMITTEINEISSHYFIISKKVKQFINDLGRADAFEVIYDVDKFLESKPLLTTAERNCLKEIRAKFAITKIKVNG